MNSQVKDVGMVAVAIAMVVVAVMGFMRVDKYIMTKAFADCAQASRFVYETQSTNESGERVVSRSEEPNREAYKTCVADKGFTSTLE